ncbi:MAG TPA: hypothetical protein VGQ13_03465 [Nitrososphaera sp.]|jgi:hypothetical protein|nr:hypothetical protein [Nitrososphaera sp.]
MVNIGLIISGAIITAFALLLLNPIFKFPDLAQLNVASINSGLEWAVLAVAIFVVIFLTGSAMMAKGFLERKVVKSVDVREIQP